MHPNLIQIENGSDPITINGGDAARVFPVVTMLPSDQSEDSLTISGTPGVIRLPRSGRYRFSGIVTVDSNDPGEIRLSIQPEGAGSMRCGGTGKASVLSPVVAYHAAGDAVSFRAYNAGTDPVALQSGAAYNYGLIEYLGE